MKKFTVSWNDDSGFRYQTVLAEDAVKAVSICFELIKTDGEITNVVSVILKAPMVKRPNLIQIDRYDHCSNCKGAILRGDHVVKVTNGYNCSKCAIDKYEKQLKDQ